MNYSKFDRNLLTCHLTKGEVKELGDRIAEIIDIQNCTEDPDILLNLDREVSLIVAILEKSHKGIKKNKVNLKVI